MAQAVTELELLHHEYALLGGLNRAQVGRYIGMTAASISAGIVFVVLSIVNVAQILGLPIALTPSVMSLICAGSVWAVLYWMFDKYVWRWQYIMKLINVPNLSGEWSCCGQTLNPDGSLSYEWHGIVTIFQSWDKIRVRLKTNQSGSNSIAAALICDDAEGFRLLYNYRNEPRINEVELKSHLGFGELTFATNLQTAEGEYFNGHGRFTFGTMKLKRQ